MGFPAAGGPEIQQRGIMTVSGYDDTSICCAALNLIGVDPISSLQEESDNAATCSRLYPLTRDSILSKHSWNFGNAERQLDRSADVIPLNDWTYAYKLPSNMLAGPTAVFGDGGDLPNAQYEVRGDYIFTDAQIVIVHYQGPADPVCWPAYFVELVVVALAARLAKPVTDNVTRAGELMEEAFGSPQDKGQGGLFAIAKRANAQSRPVQNIFRNGDMLSNTRY